MSTGPSTPGRSGASRGRSQVSREVRSSSSPGRTGAISGASAMATSFREASAALAARGQRDGGLARDDLLALLVLGPDLQVDEVDVVVLARLAEDAPATGDHVFQSHDGGEAHAELADGAGPGPVGEGLADEAHREHAVGEDAAHAGRL